LRNPQAVKTTDTVESLLQIFRAEAGESKASVLCIAGVDVPSTSSAMLEEYRILDPAKPPRNQSSYLSRTCPHLDRAFSILNNQVNIVDF
jgi:hypothetical protein